MKRYMLIAKQKGDVAYTFSGAEDRAEFMKRFGEWTKRLTANDQFVQADELPPKYKRIEQSNQTFTVLDGPYAETKEILTGYFLIRASDMGEAVEIAKACPVLRFDHLEVFELEGDQP